MFLRKSHVHAVMSAMSTKPVDIYKNTVEHRNNTGPVKTHFTQCGNVLTEDCSRAHRKRTYMYI